MSNATDAAACASPAAISSISCVMQLDGRVPVRAEAQPLRAAHQGVELVEHGLEGAIAQRGDRDPV